MRLWARGRRVLPLAVCLFLLVLAGSAVGERSAVVPVVLGTGGGSIRLAGLVPLLWAAVVADAFAGRGQAAEIRSSRRLGVLDAAYLCGVSAVAALVLARFATVGAPALSGAGAVLIASGLACAVTLRRGPGDGVFAVCALLVGTSVYAMDAPGARYIRVFQPDGDLRWSIACGLLLTAMACWLLLSNRIRTRFRPTERIG